MVQGSVPPTLSSSVSRSFFSLSLSTAFSSQRRALAFRSLAPPEITPDFWKRVPSSATVCGERALTAGGGRKGGSRWGLGDSRGGLREVLEGVWGRGHSRGVSREVLEGVGGF